MSPVSLEDDSQTPCSDIHSLHPLLALQLFAKGDIVLPVINLLMSHPTLASALKVALAVPYSCCLKVNSLPEIIFWD